MTYTNRYISARLAHLLLRDALALAGVIGSSGCLERPIAESEPVTTNVVIQERPNDAITRIDLLLMIDNSSSMADKQVTLAEAVPQLLKQLVQPQCVDQKGDPFDPPLAAQLGTDKPCAKGAPEFNPVNDIHIGIITSSLGDHGGGVSCTEGAKVNNRLLPPDVNDRAHLIATLQRGQESLSQDSRATATSLVKVDEKGFLAWGGSSQQTVPTTDDLLAATSAFRDMVKATDENGCGYESQLESWFRFLIDPVPPRLPLDKPDKDQHTARNGVDDELLVQRAAFLRPDSLLAIVMLTDENDCSLRDTDWGWVATMPSIRIRTASPKCDTDPNDSCCFACSVPAPSGCEPCSNSEESAAHDNQYQVNLRCWRQKQRFGYEFTYPTSRYSVGLTQRELCPDQTFGDMDCNCTQAKAIGASCSPGERRLPNPLYGHVVGRKDDGTDVVSFANYPTRSDNSTIFLAGIIGVPWQDIAEDATRADGKTLKYVPVTDERWTAPGGIWDTIYADYNDARKEPRDVRMHESVTPRGGLPTPEASVQADAILQHEWNTASQDLQYACTYRLPEPKAVACPIDSETHELNCPSGHREDCYPLAQQDAESGAMVDVKKPLCQNPSTGTYETTQYFAKAYPGLRELAVLKDYALQGQTAGNSIVASICPKDLASDSTSPGYGYNPAVAALIERLKAHLGGTCLPRPLNVQSNGEVPCNVIEVVDQSSLGGMDCNAFCKSKHRNQNSTGSNPAGGPSSKIAAAILDNMRNSGICDTNTTARCDEKCLCLLPQESATSNTLNTPEYSNDLQACQNADNGPANALPPGYCYVDPQLLDEDGKHLAGSNEYLVSRCPETQRRILRFVGNQPTSVGGAEVPLMNSRVFSACQGSPVTSVTP